MYTIGLIALYMYTTIGLILLIALYMYTIVYRSHSTVHVILLAQLDGIKHIMQDVFTVAIPSLHLAITAKSSGTH